MALRYLSISLKVFIISLLLTAHITSYARQSSWKTHKVALDCKDCSMTQGLEKIAQLADISILAEGEPAKKLFTMQASDNAAELLTKIADAYDYEWRVSKSGIVLLTKRFIDEHETPEINVAEMRASVQDISTIVRSVYTPYPPSASLMDAFRQLTANLSAEEANSLRSPVGLSLSTLSPASQNQAANMILSSDLQPLYLQLDYFARAIEALPMSRLAATQEIKFSSGIVSKYVRLEFGPSEMLEPSVLWDIKKKEATEAAEENVSPAPQPLREAHLRKTATVEQMFALLRKDFRIMAAITPKMQDKHVVTLLRDADAKSALFALGELENWIVQRKEGQTDAFLIYRRSVNIPSSIREVRQPILQALPPDVARCFYTRPQTLGGKAYKDVHDLFPQLPGAGDARLFADTKMRHQEEAARIRLRHSFEQEMFATPVPYSSLTAEQKRAVIQILFNQMGSQIAGSLWEFLYKPASYITNPTGARMRATEKGVIVVGPAGGKFEAIEGPSVRQASPKPL